MAKIAHVEFIPVGEFSTTTGRNYKVCVRKNGKSTHQVCFGQNGNEQEAINLGTFLTKLQTSNRLKSSNIDFEKIKELTGRSHTPSIKI